MKYFKYEVEQSKFYGRDQLIGLWINEKGKVVQDYLLCFGSKLTREQNNTEIKKLADHYNSLLNNI